MVFYEGDSMANSKLIYQLMLRSLESLQLVVGHANGLEI